MNIHLTAKPKRSLSILGGAFAAAVVINLALLLLISYLVSHRAGEEKSPAPKPQPIRFIDIASIETVKAAPPTESKEMAEQPQAKAAQATHPVKTVKKTPPKSRPRPKPTRKKTQPTPQQAAPAPKIDIPAQGTGPAFANIPGIDSRLTAPPGQWSPQQTPDTNQSGQNEKTGGGGSGSRKLTVLSRVLPTYPRRAKADGIEGWVRLEITVNPSGRVSNAQVARSSPKGIFDQAALDAIRHWRFQPAYKDGRPVMQRSFIVIKFRLEDR